MHKRKRLDSQRRSPRRAGSQATVEAIFEATARILQSDGRAGLNTNRIAERAGVSIGALYGYFPNKDAILLAMARRELDLLHDRVVAAFNDPHSDVTPARRAVRALIKGYTTRGKVRRILMETLFAHGGSEEMARPVFEIADLLAVQGTRLMPAGARKLSPVALYVLTRTVDGLIRGATYEAVPFLHSTEFEDEVVRLITSFVRPV
jgi:AcrR family transcriptional regulator